MAMLEIKNIHKAFDGLDVLRGVNLSVEKGDVVAILGKSGSGKTTLLRCINFLETADDGELVFDGETVPLHNASKRDIARIRKKTAFVFQNYNLFPHYTVMKNITDALKQRGATQQRRLTATRRPDNRHDLATLHLERDILKHLIAAKRLTRVRYSHYRSGHGNLHVFEKSASV